MTTPQAQAGQPLVITVGAVGRVPLAGLPAGVGERVRGVLSFPNPERAKAARRGRQAVGAEAAVCAVREEDDGFGGGADLVVPRGALGVVRRILREAGVAHELAVAVAEGERLEATIRIDPRDYQVAAVQALVQHRGGLVVIPCGGGKTVVGLAAAAALRRSTLVLVHTKDLLAQWVERARDVLGLEAGVIGDGVREVRPVTVATVQTLVRLDDWDMAEVAGRFGTVIVDEVHHAPARTWAAVVDRCPARYRIGLTATPDRDDGLTPLMGWAFGPVVSQVTQEQLVRAGYLVPPEVCDVETGWSADLDELAATVRDRKADEWQAAGWSERAIERGLQRYAYDPGDRMPDWLVTEIYAALVADPARNRLVVNIAAEAMKRGRLVLVLSGRKAHCEAIAEGLRARGVEATVLTSEVGKKKRAEALARFRAGELRCLVATQLADEGLDVPRLDRVILACPSRSASRTIQRLGRLMRPAEKDVPRLYDLVDDMGVFRSQAKARRGAYRKALGTYRHATWTPQVEAAGEAVLRVGGGR